MTASFDVAAAAEYLRSRIESAPAVCIVLGSGLSAIEGELTDASMIPFEDVPGFPAPSVEGHAGRYVVGRLGGADVLIQSGRFHFYEGHSSDVVGAPVRIAASLGVRGIVFTNASGAIRPTLEPGDLVLLSDHINLMSRSPLVGPVLPNETRFPDMSAAYDPRLRELALEAALETGEPLHEGTYVAVLGPSYETPAEVRMLGGFGADVVGMSTVPEVLVARALGLRCVGFSVVTNQAAGLNPGTLSHREVLDVGASAGARLAALLTLLVPRVADELSGRGQSGLTK